MSSFQPSRLTCHTPSPNVTIGMIPRTARNGRGDAPAIVEFCRHCRTPFKGTLLKTESLTEPNRDAIMDEKKSSEIWAPLFLLLDISCNASMQRLGQSAQLLRGVSRFQSLPSRHVFKRFASTGSRSSGVCSSRRKFLGRYAET